MRRWPKRFGQAHRRIESFNARLRDECLNEEVFDSPGVERKALAIWRHNDNNVPPQLAMGTHHARGRARVVQALCELDLRAQAETSPVMQTKDSPNG